MWWAVVCFVATLIFIYKVVRLDYPDKKPNWYVPPPERPILLPPSPQPQVRVVSFGVWQARQASEPYPPIEIYHRPEVIQAIRDMKEANCF